MDDVETCQDLNLRMQSILVKQHVLEALNTHEQKGREESQESAEEESEEEESSSSHSEEDPDFDRQEVQAEAKPSEVP